MGKISIDIGSVDSVLKGNVRKPFVSKNSAANLNAQSVVRNLLNENPEMISFLQDDSDHYIGFFVGQAMKETNGKADPSHVAAFTRTLAKSLLTATQIRSINSLDKDEKEKQLKSLTPEQIKQVSNFSSEMFPSDYSEPIGAYSAKKRFSKKQQQALDSIKDPELKKSAEDALSSFLENEKAEPLTLEERAEIEKSMSKEKPQSHLEKPVQNGSFARTGWENDAVTHKTINIVKKTIDDSFMYQQERDLISKLFAKGLKNQDEEFLDKVITNSLMSIKFAKSKKHARRLPEEDAKAAYEWVVDSEENIKPDDILTLSSRLRDTSERGALMFLNSWFKKNENKATPLEEDIEAFKNGSIDAVLKHAILNQVPESKETFAVNIDPARIRWDNKTDVEVEEDRIKSIEDVKKAIDSLGNNEKKTLLAELGLVFNKDETKEDVPLEISIKELISKFYKAKYSGSYESDVVSQIAGDTLFSINATAISRRGFGSVSLINVRDGDSEILVKAQDSVVGKISKVVKLNSYINVVGRVGVTQTGSLMIDAQSISFASAPSIRSKPKRNGLKDLNDGLESSIDSLKERSLSFEEAFPQTNSLIEKDSEAISDALANLERYAQILEGSENSSDVAFTKISRNGTPVENAKSHIDEHIKQVENAVSSDKIGKNTKETILKSFREDADFTHRNPKVSREGFSVKELNDKRKSDINKKFLEEKLKQMREERDDSSLGLEDALAELFKESVDEQKQDRVAGLRQAAEERREDFMKEVRNVQRKYKQAPKTEWVEEVTWDATSTSDVADWTPDTTNTEASSDFGSEGTDQDLYDAIESMSEAIKKLKDTIKK